jgi:hypothetical protein
MGGGLMQLVAYGAQDIYLTGNPQITFFKVVYRRHTNFAMESIEQTFNGSVALGRRVTATISRNGDLIKDMWLECEFGTTNLDHAVYGLGNALVKQVEIEIGGQLIDRQYGEWMNIWTELSTPEGKRVGYDQMVGNFPSASSTFVEGGTGTETASGPDARLDVPLQFWFNRNPGLALPLIALQYHEVKLNLDLETAAKLSTDVSEVQSLTSCKLYVDYIYLDTDERRRFAQVSHEYLIEQVQFTGDESITQGTTKRVDLSFNHPVKELVWVAQSTTQARSSDDGNNPCQFQAMYASGQTSSTKLQLNGHDRFTERRNEYFARVQTYKHHTHMPRSSRATCLSVNVNADTDSTVDVVDKVTVVEDNAQHINVYSFALNPEEHQPSGTCNFSRIDNATLVLTNPRCATGVLKVFAVNYNVLRIMSGMGGLAYSN